MAQGSSCLRQVKSNVRNRGSDTYRVDCRGALIVSYSQLTIDCCGRPVAIAQRVGVAAEFVWNLGFRAWNLTNDSTRVLHPQSPQAAKIVRSRKIGLTGRLGVVDTM